METLTTNTQATANYRAAIREIQGVLDEMGFTTDNPFDAAELENRLVDILRQNIEGNVNYASVTG